MQLEVRIKMNSKLYLRNPEESVLGKKIVKQGLCLINKLGFEEFTFKKLAAEVKTTEASIYRYFENKHKLLVYLITWYWSFLEYKFVFSINNIPDAEQRLKTVIRIITEEPRVEIDATDFISESESYKLVIWEGSKAYLTRNVSKDNKDRLFKPYKDLCERFSQLIKAYNPRYKFPHSLASTILEMAHSQKFFQQNLPSLTDFPKDPGDKKIISFLESLLFNSIKQDNRH
jgi:AcrR family transcriptional regulator